MSTTRFMQTVFVRVQDDDRKIEVIIIHELLHCLYQLTGIDGDHKNLEDSIIVISHALADLRIETEKKGRKK